MTGYYDRAGPYFTTYAWDRDTGKSEAVSVASTGAVSRNGSVGTISLSRNGELVLFGSRAYLTSDESQTDDTSQLPEEQDADVFVRDRVSGATVRVSRPGANPMWSVGSYPSEISRNGRWAVFYSSHDTLVPNDNNGYIGDFDVFIQSLERAN